MTPPPVTIPSETDDSDQLVTRSGRRVTRPASGPSSPNATRQRNPRIQATVEDEETSLQPAPVASTSQAENVDTDDEEASQQPAPVASTSQAENVDTDDEEFFAQAAANAPDSANDVADPTVWMYGNLPQSDNTGAVTRGTSNMAGQAARDVRGSSAGNNATIEGDDDGVSQYDPDTSCHMCHQTLFQPAVDTCTVYPCLHGHFHYECIVRCFGEQESLNNIRSGRKCPMCRATVEYVRRQDGISGEVTDHPSIEEGSRLNPTNNLYRAWRAGAAPPPMPEAGRDPSNTRSDVSMRDVGSNASDAASATSATGRAGGAATAASRIAAGRGAAGRAPPLNQSREVRREEDPRYILDGDRSTGVAIWKKIVGLYVAKRAKAREGQENDQRPVLAARFLLESDCRNPAFPSLKVYELEAQSRYPGAKARYEAQYGALVFRDPSPIDDLGDARWEDLEVTGVARVWQNLKVDEGRVRMPKRQAQGIVRLRHVNNGTAEKWYREGAVEMKFNRLAVKQSVKEYTDKTNQHTPIVPQTLRGSTVYITRPIEEFSNLALRRPGAPQGANRASSLNDDGPLPTTEEEWEALESYLIRKLRVVRSRRGTSEPASEPGFNLRQANATPASDSAL